MNRPFLLLLQVLRCVSTFSYSGISFDSLTCHSHMTGNILNLVGMVYCKYLTVTKSPRSLHMTVQHHTLLAVSFK